MGLIATAPQPVGPLRFIASSGMAPLLIDDFSNLLIERRIEDFVAALQFADSRLRGLDLATFCGESHIYANLDIGRLLPTALMGEGVRRLMTFVFAIANCSRGVVIVDEIENGLHHSIMEKVWRAIGEAARTADCQVFATTHSYECIQAAQKAFANNGEDDLTLIRLEREGDTVRPVVISEESLATAMEFDWEIR
jgi:predicted ATP-dependent endonuclease of OLD family